MRLWLLIMLFLVQWNLAFAQSPSVPEAEVKAVFLFHFTAFVDWPASTFRTPNEPLVIGVLGKSPFGKYLENAINGEKKGEHPLVVKYYTSVAEIEACHILFIAKTTEEELEVTLNAIKGRNILTVGDSPYFTTSGGMIKFFLDNNKVRLQINLEAVKNANLTMSSKLLKVAEILKPSQP